MTTALKKIYLQHLIIATEIETSNDCKIQSVQDPIIATFNNQIQNNGFKVKLLQLFNNQNIYIDRYRLLDVWFCNIEWLHYLKIATFNFKI